MNISAIYLALFFLLGGLVNPLCFAQHTKETYTFAVVPQYDVRTLFSTWVPVMKYLEEATGYHMVLDISPDIPTFEKRFINGVYDFAFANPAQYLTAAKRQGYQAIIRDNSRDLQGIVVTRKGGDITQVEQLDGNTVAFPAPNALGACLMVRYELEGLHGIKLKPRYVRTHNSAYLQVATGRMTAAGGVLSTLKQQPEEVQERLQIIYQTQKVNPHPISAHPRVNKTARDKVREAFLSLAKSTAGKKLLEKIPLIEPVVATSEEYQKLSTYDWAAFLQE